MQPIRLLIVDDHEPFRRGLKAMLEGEEEVKIVGEAADGLSAVQQAELLQPDVILMDLNMLSVNGLEATRRILLTSPHIRVLVLTMSDEDEAVFAAFQAGARGYLVKGALKGDVIRSIESVQSGDVIFGSVIARRMIQFFSKIQMQMSVNTFPELTEREREILGFMAHNRSNQEIADQLGLSIKTVRNHISNICTKLQVTDRYQAILKARDSGLS